MTTIEAPVVPVTLTASGPPPIRKVPIGRQLRRNVNAYLFLVGAMLCFTLFSWYPIVREVVLSFEKTNFVGSTKWVGLHNYHQIFADPEFKTAWKATAIFSLMALVLGYIVPFAMAVVINELRHARGYFRLLVYLPVMMPPTAAAILFQWLYTPGSGLFDAALHAVGLPTSQWLDSTKTAMLSLVLFSTWINMGGGTLIYLASLQGIPGELYEAAEIDGAGIFKRIWHVTIPQTRLILSVMLMLQIISTMQVFLEPFILTGGGPEGQTTTVVYLIYEYAFHYSNYGSAAALGVLLLLVLAGFGAIYLRLTQRSLEA